MKSPPLISDYLLLTSNEKALVARQRAIDIDYYERLLEVAEEIARLVERDIPQT